MPTTAFSPPPPPATAANTTKPPNTTTAAAAAAAAINPDALTLTSWEAAFAAHPLPGLRRLESQLRAQIAEHRARLRSLVGAHYRDLLGTADRIVDMHAASSRAERVMSDAGRRCNVPLLERGARNVGLRVGGRVGERERLLVAGRLLRAAIAGCGRIVRKGEDGLLAAKMVVLARLLVKGVGDGDGGEELRGRLGRARERLLEYLARRLGVTTITTTTTTTTTQGVGREETVGVLCAYALITSSAPGDVLRFFLQVRLRQIEELGESAREEQLLGMLELYRRTLLDVRELFPRRFADGLARLSKTVLVKDAQVRAAAELNLDIYEQWIAEDVRNFTPWFRHDQLSPSDVGAGLASWAKRAQESLLQGLGDTLEGMSDARVVLELRQKVLSRLLSLSTKVRDQSHSRAIDEIRAAFLARLGALADGASLMASFDQTLQSQQENRSIWEMALENIDLDRGALEFRQTILQRQHGRNISTQEVTTALDDWVSRINEFQQQISLMSSTRWDDDFDTDLDELEDGERIQTTLTETDPEELKGRLRGSTANSLRQVYAQVGAQSKADADAALLIRIVREVDQRRGRLIGLLEKTDPVRADGVLIATLYERVAKTVLQDPIKEYLEGLQRHSPPPVIVWDGTPPLPVQTSPSTFRFLSSLHRAMSAAGNDLWSVEAVRKLQEVAAGVLAGQLGDLPDIDSASADDQPDAQEKEGGEAAENRSGWRELRREQCLQRLFDALYLLRVLTRGDTKVTSGKLDGAVGKLTEELKLEEPLAERLEKNANEYWRKTHLLFGLLAPGQRS